MRLREAGEDYLETILQLEDQDKKIRSVDIANKLSVSRPSVNKAMNILRENGLIEQELYGTIMLTPKGRKIAESVHKRHSLIKNFLMKQLYVDELVAEKEACGMEHAMSDDTMDKLANYLDNLK
ncbi:MAG: metal-dependent transcriptional regulator [Oscillospiraceae bacterium]